MSLMRSLLYRIVPLVLFLATAMVVSFYVRSSVLQAENYALGRDLISEIKQLDAQWNTEILKSRVAVTRNYDPLVMPLAQINKRWQQFQNLQLEQLAESTQLRQERRDAFARAFKEKQRLVEQFKSHNAILRNSLAFLPTAEDDIQAQLNDLEDIDKLRLHTISTTIYDLLLSSLEFAQVTSDELAHVIELGISEVDVDKSRLPKSFEAPIDIALNHVRLVRREQPVVNNLLESIARVPVAPSLDMITLDINADEREADRIAQKYQVYTIIFAALMLALLIFTGSRLVRSYSEINRMNEALQVSNEKLEERVESRTLQLREAQSELLATARLAGMAEIATNVLHNVGNVLNSVNISADLLGRKLRSSKTLGLSKVVQMMKDHKDELGHFIDHDEKGKMLPAYLSQLSEAIANEQQSMRDELVQLTASVDHIKEIVATQQSYAGAAKLEEPLHINVLLEDALRMNAGALTRHQVAVVREFEHVPLIMGDKHRLLLILINLISNAKQAMSDLPGRSRQITLQVKVIEPSTLQISVKDDGEGILPENMSRLFTHGFTTRKDGHGFGLHSCALAAVEMKGRLTAHSNGPGCGATFTLELPLKPVVEPA
jgi:two-component system NtrC family sensor kinase